MWPDSSWRPEDILAIQEGDRIGIVMDVLTDDEVAYIGDRLTALMEG